MSHFVLSLAIEGEKVINLSELEHNVISIHLNLSNFYIAICALNIWQLETP